MRRDDKRYVSEARKNKANKTLHVSNNLDVSKNTPVWGHRELNTHQKGVSRTYGGREKRSDIPVTIQLILVMYYLFTRYTLVS